MPERDVAAGAAQAEPAGGQATIPTTGPDEVEALVASLADLRNTDAEHVERLLAAVDKLHREYRWMHRCFTIACGGER